MIFTKRGLAIKVNAKDFPTQLRSGMGVRAINLDLSGDGELDEIVSVITFKE